jgi:thiol:disulfide interchange protein DsbA
MPHPLYRLLLILLTCALPLTAVHATDPAAPPTFEEGKDYLRLPTSLPTATPGKIEVMEFFSYTCPHCRSLEPSAQAWLKRKPENVAFMRIAVSFSANWEPSARAYYAAEALGVLDKVHQPLFEAVHNNPRINLDEFAAFFAEQGVDQDAFRKAYSSFQTETQLRRGTQIAQRYKINGVPAIIVNGEYDVRSPRMFETVDFLIAQKVAVPTPVPTPAPTPVPTPVPTLAPN